ncbi:MAG: META domain-containing protein [Flavobacteriales bacterium]
MKTSFLVLLLTFGIISCGMHSDKRQTTDLKKVTINGFFLLIGFDQGEFPVPADKSHPTFKLNSKEKTITGFAGCNDIRGTFSITNTEIHFKQMVTTRKACFDDEYEPKVLKAFQEATRYTLNGDRLILRKGNNTLMILRKLDV